MADQRKTERQLGFEAGIEAAAKLCEELGISLDAWEAAEEIRALGADGATSPATALTDRETVLLEAARIAARFAEATEEGPGVAVARAIEAECKRRARQTKQWLEAGRESSKVSPATSPTDQPLAKNMDEQCVSRKKTGIGMWERCQLISGHVGRHLGPMCEQWGRKSSEARSGK